MNSLVKNIALSLLLVLSGSVWATDGIENLSTVKRGWLNGKNCAWILAGLQITPASDFDIMPRGQLSKTLKSLHPDKLKANRSVDWSMDRIGQTFLVQVFGFGGIVEREFERIKTGDRPINLGKYATEHTEIDPLFGDVILTYTADATNQAFNSRSISLLEKVENQLRSRIITSTAPSSIGQSLELLLYGSGGTKDFVEEYDFSSPKPDDPGYRYVKAILQDFGATRGKALLEVERDARTVVVEATNVDKVRFSLRLDFHPEPDDLTPRYPLELFIRVESEEISLSYHIQFASQPSVVDVVDSSEMIAAKAGADWDQAVRASQVVGIKRADGYCKKTRVGSEQATVFIATKFEKVENGKVTFELVPFFLQVPDYFQIKDRLYRVSHTQSRGNKFELVDTETGKKYQGKIVSRVLEHEHLWETYNLVVTLPEAIINSGAQ